MPSYELALLLRKLGRVETADVLKRTAINIFKNNGLLFGIENLGTRPLPYKISSFGKRHTEAGYFLMRFDSPSTAIGPLTDEYARDVDIIRAGFIKQRPTEHYECTLEEESKPPAYREDVKKMIETGRKRGKTFDMKIGLKYNPFNR